jgi:ferredoxin
MDIDSVKLVYFSPTKTTQQVIENIAKGIQADEVEQIDLTAPEAETKEYEVVTSGLTIIGAPTYGGRLPVAAVRRFERLRANNAPAVVVAVYGNRDYEDALLELKNLAEERGFNPIAGGTFIGEHSFSRDDMPIAQGRPDSADLKKAQKFGEEIKTLLSSTNSIDDLSPLKIPGNFPYKERSESSQIAPFIDKALCTNCEDCIEVCPTGSITLKDELQIDPNTCILCCACIKECPCEALYFTSPGINKVTEWLYTNFSERKEPELFVIEQ